MGMSEGGECGGGNNNGGSASRNSGSRVGAGASVTTGVASVATRVASAAGAGVLHVLPLPPFIFPLILILISCIYIILIKIKR